MELTVEQRRNLRSALMAAFSRQPRLGLMVEDELGEDLNQITQGQSDYELVVQDLVKWADSQGRLRELVIGALWTVPGNSSLGRFVQRNLRLPLQFDALLELFRLLSPIDISILREAYRECLSGRSRGISETRAALIERLADIPGEPDEPKPLHRFVSFLIQEQSLDSDQQQALRAWAEAQGISPDIATSEPETVETYLMVKVQPRGGSLGYNVSAAIAKDPAPHQLDAEVKSRSIPISIPPDPKTAPGYSEDDLPRILDELLDICGEDTSLDELIVQWFLPIELMNWEIEHLPILIGKKAYCHGGQCRAVVVRSFERHFQRDYKKVSGIWKKHWQRLLTCLGSRSSQSLDVLDHVTGCTKIAWSNAQVVGCRFMAHGDERQQQDLWDDLLSQGVPIALWMRQPGTSAQDGATVMQAVIDRPLRELPLSLTEQRRVSLARGTDSTPAPQTSAAHLSLLWDNPFRPFPTIDYQSA